MHVRKLIASNPEWLTELTDTYKIDVVHDESADLVSLKYNQLESPMAEPIVQECRGMVVDLVTKTVVAHPYNKFWNLGEHLADPIEWASARVQDKLDGSLMILFFHRRTNQWRVASSGHPTAGGSFGRGNTATFGEAFWAIFHATGMELPHAFKHVTFMFELCAAENRVIVRHEQPKIVLHGARDLVTGVELGRRLQEDIARACRWVVVQEYPIGSADEAVEAAAILDPIQNEGFVVVDAKFRRVKIKSPRYVVLHHMKGDATPRRAIELWQTGDQNELLVHFPEMRSVIDPVHYALDEIASSVAETYAKERGAPTKKDFAMRVKQLPASSVLFKIWDRGVHNNNDATDDAKEIMRAMNLSALEKMLERSHPNVLMP